MRYRRRSIIARSAQTNPPLDSTDRSAHERPESTTNREGDTGDDVRLTPRWTRKDELDGLDLRLSDEHGCVAMVTRNCSGSSIETQPPKWRPAINVGASMIQFVPPYVRARADSSNSAAGAGCVSSRNAAQQAQLSPTSHRTACTNLWRGENSVHPKPPRQTPAVRP
jgi:hypothetical protein